MATAYDLQVAAGTRLKPERVRRLHVDQHAIKANTIDGGTRPCVTIQTSNGPLKCHEARIDGPSTLVSRPDRPLSCGARVWIETTAAIEIVR